MGDIIFVLDDEDRILYANREAVRRLGGGRDSLVGLPAAQVFPEAVRDKVTVLRARWADSSERGADSVIEAREIEIAGVWWAVRMFAIPDGLVVAVRDVDARHRADAERAKLIGSLTSALRRSRQLLDLTVDVGQALTVDELCDIAAVAAHADLGSLFTGLVLFEDEGRSRVLTRPRSAFLTEAWSRPPGLGPAVTTEVLRTGRPRFDENRSTYLRDFPEREPHLNAAGIDAIASLPLIVSGQPIGLLMLAWPREHHFDEDERRFLLTAVGPFAQAIERARLHERQMSTVETLQRAVLPRALPELDLVRLAARYLPAGRDLGIGGDWYDATVLANGTLSLVVGDVGGHGLPAVSTMAELRHASRAYALRFEEPAEITTQLSANLNSGPDGPYATAVVAQLCPETRRLIWSCAGHPPPLVVLGPTGTDLPPDDPAPTGAVPGTRYLEQVHGPILGVDATARYGQSSVELPAGSSLLLYTDGLVERRGRSLSDQLVALATAVAGSLPRSRGDPDLLCDDILRAIAPPEREDDLCLLAVALR
jgi:hypothetical protein